MSFFDHPVGSARPANVAPSKSQLDVEKIRKLPRDRNKPLYGLSEAQARALGIDPKEYEASRLESIAREAESAAQAQRAEAADLVAAARSAVESFEVTPQQAAEALRTMGNAYAFGEFVTGWQTDEALDAQGDELLSADEYVQRLRQVEDGKNANAKREQAQERVDSITEQLDRFGVGASHALRNQIEQGIVDSIRGDADRVDADKIPAGEAAQARLAWDATESVFANAEQLRQFREIAEGSWRAAKGLRSSGPAMTDTDHKLAHAAFVEQRVRELSEIASQEQREAEAAEIRPTASLGFQPASVTESPYRAALRKSEEASGIFRDENGNERAVPMSVAAPHGVPIEEPSTRHQGSSTPDLPDEWPDEYGPGGYS